MKIAILSPFYPYRGGIAQFSAMLYKTLETGHEIKAFSFSRMYPDFLFPGKTQLVEEGDQAIPIVAERRLDSIDPFSYLQTAKAIARFQPDVLVVVYWMPFFAPAYATIVKRLKKRTIVIGLLHNAIPHEPHFFDRPLSKYFFKQCRGFIVMSEIVKRDLLSILPEAHYIHKQHPIYNHFGKKLSSGVAKSRLGLNAGKKTLLFFGLIREYKGLDLLIEALSHLDDSYELLIAGESYGSFQKYQKQIDHSPAKERIIVKNYYIEDKDVPVLFSAADVLVLPYKSATQSGVLPVAYHYETPVVATDVGGFREAIEQAGSGVVCSSNAKALAEGIGEIFRTGQEKFLANIRLERENLSWDSFATALVEFAERLLLA
ncbi:MAG: glycosyltransferase [Dysgonamonadaceae bacterium]|jgi:glycosyltransferase involved in cell wall biosynthesis|nr:glycosyltransferase [Dysgonamonadaceae bacterium]